jgi:hypothetical protein
VSPDARAAPAFGRPAAISVALVVALGLTWLAPVYEGNQDAMTSILAGARADERR